MEIPIKFMKLAGLVLCSLNSQRRFWDWRIVPKAPMIFFRRRGHRAGPFFTGWGLRVLVLLLTPVVAVGQEAVPQIQIKEAADRLPQSSSATFEEEPVEVSVAVMRVSEEGADSRLWNMDMGGVNLFRLPEPPIHPLHALSPDALIGPVWNHGIIERQNETDGFGGQYWNRQGMANPAQNSITILEGNSEDIEISIGEQPSSDVTVVITGHADTDLTVSPSTLTFTASDWADKSVTLVAGHDDDATSDELTLTITTTQGSNESSVQRAVTIVDDEIVWELTPWVMGEGTSRTDYIHLRDLGPPSGDVTFTLTGHEGTDIVPRSTTLTFPASSWWIPQGLDLLAEVDEDNQDERVTLTLTAAGGGYNGLTYSLEVIIEDRPAYEELIPEGRSIVFGLTILSTVLPQSDLVGTYTGYQGTDLTVSPPSVTYKANQWGGPCRDNKGQLWDHCSAVESVEIRAAHDPDDEDDQETLVFTVPFKVEARINIRIEDDDDPGLVVSPSSLGIPEGGRESFTVRLSEAPLGDFENNDVTVHVPRSQGDLTASPSSLTFTKDTWNRPQQVELSAGHDADLEDDFEGFAVTASGGGFDRERGVVSVRIFDDDGVSVPVVAGIELVPSSLNVTEGSLETYSVGLLSEPTWPVTVTIVESGGGVTASPLVLHFTASDWDESQQVSVRADSDANSINETSTLIHTATSADPGYSGRTAILSVTVVDLDMARLEVTPGELTIGEGASAEFTVKLSSEPTAGVTVQIPTFTNPDLSHDRPILTFTPSTWDAPQTVTVSAKKDTDAEDEAPETLTLRASGGEYDGITGTVVVTVEDRDQKGILLDPLSLELEEAGAAGTYTVALQSAPTSDVTVAITGPSAQVTLDRESLTFTPATWDDPQTITVQALEDQDTDDEQFLLTHRARGGGYDTETADLDVRIKDKGEVALSIYDAQVDEGVGSVDLRVELNQPTGRLVSVMYRAVAEDAEAGSDYEDSRGIVLFTPGATKGKIRLNILEDELPEPDETFTVVLSGARHAVIARGSGR
ncbi:MAG: hypothetical protein F4Y63_03200, partial [Chloroflexi bacterium]|nr:hypothetical protein [Chloroflexota bacterium]